MQKHTASRGRHDGLHPILQVLVDDARRTPIEIATMVGSDPVTVQKQIAVWEADRLILRYKAVVDRERAGVDEVVAMIEIRANLQSGRGYEEVARCLSRFEQVRSLYLVSGNYDLLAVVSGRSLREVAAFVAENLAPLDGILTVNTHFLLRAYKEDGDVFVAGDEAASRLPVAP